jgi:shikimate dehydrogenase
VQLGSLGTRLPAGLDPAVVVQATPLGSRGERQASRPLPEWQPRPGTVVLDMVYQPYWTLFLREVAAVGAIPVPGAAMFLHQAAEQLRHFGLAAPAVEELRDCLAGTAVSALPLPAAGPAKA